MNTETSTAALIAERDEITEKIARALDVATKRSLAARKAHLTRKINAASTTAFAPTATRPTISIDPNAPLAPRDIIAETRAMLAEHNLTGWTVNLSNIMTKTYGLCDYRKREIRIAARVAALNPAAETRDTIAHEVAHAIAGHKAGHGPEWKRACRVTGANPTRCHSANTVQTAARYRGECTACGQTVGTRKVAPSAGRTYYHRPTACRESNRGIIRWVDTRR